MQITETVPPEVLFSNYVYFSSFSDAAVSSAKAIARKPDRGKPKTRREFVGA